jgi:Na+/proline symporter
VDDAVVRIRRHKARQNMRLTEIAQSPALGGAVAVGFFGIAYFNNNPSLAGAVNQNAERVFIEALYRSSVIALEQTSS